MAGALARAAAPKERGVRSEARKAGNGNEHQATEAGLDLLRVLGWLVVHDVTVPESTQVVDHVAAGASGVYVINQVHGGGVVEATEDKLTVGGASLHDELAEVTAAAELVRTFLKGRAVAPLLCFNRSDEVLAFVGGVAVCSTENVLDVLTGQNPVFDPATQAQVARELTGALHAAPVRRSVAPAQAAASVDPAVAESRDGGARVARKPSRLRLFSRGSDDKSAAASGTPLEGESSGGRTVGKAPVAPAKRAKIDEQKAAEQKTAEQKTALPAAEKKVAPAAPSARVQVEPTAAAQAPPASQAAPAGRRIAAPPAPTVRATTAAPDADAARAEIERVTKEAHEAVAAERSRLAEERARLDADREKARAEVAEVQQQARAEAEAARAETVAAQEKAKAEVVAAQEQVRAQTEAVRAEAEAARETARLEAEAVVQKARAEADAEKKRIAAELEKAAMVAARLGQERAQAEAAKVEAMAMAETEAKRIAHELKRAADEERAVLIAAREAAEAAKEQAKAEAEAEKQRIAGELEKANADRARLEAERLEAQQAARQAVEQAVEAAKVEARQAAQERKQAVMAEQRRIADERRAAASEREQAEAEHREALAEQERVAAERQRVTEERRRAEQAQAEAVAERKRAAEERKAAEVLAAQAERERKAAERRAADRAAREQVVVARAKEHVESQYGTDVLPAADPKVAGSSLPTRFGGLEHAKRPPRAEKPSVAAEKSKAKMAGALKLSAVAAIVVALVFGLGPQMSGAVEWGKGLFGGRPAAAAGEEVAVEANTYHPDLRVVADKAVATTATGNVKGKVYAVRIQVQNAGTEKFTTPLKVVGVDTIGVAHPLAKGVSAVKAGKLMPTTVQLAPQRVASGYVAFAVPAGRTLTEVRLELSSAKDDTIVWKLG